MSTKEPSSLDPRAPTGPGTLPFKADSYLEHLDDLDLTETQKVEFLRALWNIMATFVRMGFGVESVIPAIFQKASEIGADALEETIPTHEFNAAAEDETNNKKEN